MNDLHNRAQPHRAASLVIEKLGRKKKQRRTNALASTVAQVLADLCDRLHARNGILSEFALERRKLVVQQVDNFLPVHSRRCPQSLCAPPVSSVLKIFVLIRPIIHKLQSNPKSMSPPQGDDF